MSKPSSLRVRVLVGAVIWILVAVASGGYAVVEVFRDSAMRQFDQKLEQELTLLSVAVATAPENPSQRMTSPAFARVYSGFYWQAERDGMQFKSRSLWDQVLEIPTGQGMVRSEAIGPDDQNLRLLSRNLRAPDGVRWQLTVAADLAKLEEETALFQRGLLPAAGWLAAALIAAAVLVLHAALSPLKHLREAVRGLRAEDAGAITQSFPSEVAPLVRDLNDMLQKNTRLRIRGRAQAANLAHALKTPAAILMNEIDRVRSGEQLDLAIAEDAVGRIANVASHHASAAGAPPNDRPPDQRYDAVPLLDGVCRAIRKLFPELVVESDMPPRLQLAVAPSDQQEIYGNLLENAGKWAKSRIEARLSNGPDGAAFVVEDDGIGVPDAQRAHILHQGVRLDENKSGSGLGLAIVEEIVDRYDGSLDLDRSRMGGLKVQVVLPRQPPT